MLMRHSTAEWTGDFDLLHNVHSFIEYIDKSRGLNHTANSADMKVNGHC